MHLKKISRNWNPLVIALACCVINLILDGLTRLCGLLFLEVRNTFDVNRRSASFPFALNIAIRNLSGPFVGLLADCYGVGTVTLTGGIITSIGVGLCFFAESISWITISWGVVFGIGYGLGNILLPLIIIHNFTENMPIGQGIIACGSCIGSLGLPFLQYLLNDFGLSGTYLLLSGLMMQCIPLAFLTIVLTSRKDTEFFSFKQSRHVKSNVNISEVESQPTYGSLRSKSCTLPASKLSAPTPMDECSYCALRENQPPEHEYNNRSMSHLQTRVTLTNINETESEELDGDAKSIHDESGTTFNDINELNQNESVHNITSSASNSVELTELCCTEDANHLPTTTNEEITSEDSNNRIKNNVLNVPEKESENCYNNFTDNFQSNDSLKTPKQEVESLNAENNCEPSTCIKMPEQHAHKNSTEKLPNVLFPPSRDSRMKVKVIEYTMNVNPQFLPADDIEKHIRTKPTCYRRHANSVSYGIPYEYNYQPPTITTNSTKNENLFKNKHSAYNRILNLLKPLKIFRNVSFLMIALIMAFYEFIFVTTITIVEDLAQGEKQLTEDRFKWILTSFSVGNIIGRLGLSWVANRNVTSDNVFAALSFVGIGLCVSCVSIAEGFVPFTLAFLAYGIFESGAVISFPVLIQKHIQDKELTMAVSSSTIGPGIATLVIPLAVGAFKDLTGSYNGLLYVIVALAIASAVVCLLLPLASKMNIKMKTLGQ